MREGDAELAEAEDDPRESAVDPDDSQGRAEMQAHVEFEENAFMNDAGTDDDFFDTSHSPPPEMEDEEEGEEETEKQRKDDEDYQYPSNPSTQSSTGNNEELLREEGPKRCMTKLEALSAIA